MSLVIPSSSAAPLHFSKLEINNLSSHQKFASNSFIPFHREVGFCCKTRRIGVHVRNEPNVLHKYTVRSKGYDFESIDNESLGFDDDEVDTGSPWEGAVVYKRNASILHLEYCTTLERLGLAKLSTDVSKTRAAAMGLRVTKAVREFPNGTPVHNNKEESTKMKEMSKEKTRENVVKENGFC